MGPMLPKAGEHPAYGAWGPIGGMGKSLRGLKGQVLQPMRKITWVSLIREALQ
jgi:hypothetical protein